MKFKSLYFLSISLAFLCSNSALAADNKYGKFPLSFEKNLGQAGKHVKFLSRGSGFGLFLTKDQAILRLTQPKAADVGIRLVGQSSNPQIEAMAPLPGKTHYLKGDRPAGWHGEVPNYERVRYGNVYPGIDLVYYGNQRQLEYDFVVAPGARPDRIQIEFDGIRGMTIGADGQLILGAAGGEIHQKRPVIYQEIDGRRISIGGGYVLQGGNRVSFEIASYDSTRELIIDPVLVYATYFGGDGTADQAYGIVVDAAGNAYVTGQTTSTDLLTVGGVQAANAGQLDGFILKLNPAGTDIIYSTYFGGSANDEGHSIAIDGAGNAYVTGFTTSTNFPVVNGFQSTRGGAFDAYVLKLNSTGNQILFSSYLGGSGDDRGFGIAVDTSGNAYIAGATSSPNFPTLNPFQVRNGGGQTDVFVTKVSSAGAVVYSTYVGGIGVDQAYGIALDQLRNAYVTGYSTSANFPLVNAFQPGFVLSTDDAFLFKLNAAGNALEYSTLLGGSGSDNAVDVAVDDEGGAYITGYTSSPDFPLVRPYQAFPSGDFDAFITRFSPDGKSLVFSTYFGGFDTDSGTSIAVDNAGNVFVAGYTVSFDLPVVNATQNFIGGNRDAFVTKWIPDGTTIVYATYMGGLDNDAAVGMALDALGNAYVAGLVGSTDFPVANPVQVANAAAQDAFIAKINAEDIVSTVQLQLADSGGASFETRGTRTDAVFGYAVAEPGAPGTRLNGLAIVDRSEGGAVVTEVGVPAPPLTEIGRMFVNTVGATQSVISIANPNGAEASVDLFFTDEAGTTANFATVKIAPGAHFSRFVTDDPLFVPGEVIGALNYTSSLPVAVSGFRTFSNEGGEFLISNLPIADPLNVTNQPAVIPQLSEGAGWNTKVVLVNTTEEPMNGEVRFLDQSGGPVEVGIGEAFASVVEYDIPARSAREIETTGSTTRSEFPFSARGGFTFRTPGSGIQQLHGYAAVENSGTGASLNGLQIIEYRPGNVTASQAAMLPAPLRIDGSVFVEATSSVRSMIAIANTAGEDTAVEFVFTDTAGTSQPPVTIAVPAGGQIFNFAGEAPISVPANSSGALRFSSPIPVAVTALRFLTNENNEALISATPIADPATLGDQPAVVPQFVDGAGWNSQVVLVNPSDTEMQGQLRFFNQEGVPAPLRIGEDIVSTVEYHVLPHSAQQFATSGESNPLQMGSVQILPYPGHKTPHAQGILNLRNGTVSVSENAVEGQAPGVSFRLYAEAFGDFDGKKAKSTRTAVAFANPSESEATVQLSLTRLDGTSLGTSNPIHIPARGQVAMFLNSAPGFESLKPPFQGILRVTATSGAVAAVGVRALINEAGNFLAATTGPLYEGPDTQARLVFPYVTDGTGYTTQLILTGASPGQELAGVLRFFSQDASGLALPELRMGSVRIVPFDGFNAPHVHGLISFQNAGITTFQTAIEGQRPGSGFRMYAESQGDFDATGTGATRTSLALANPTSETVSIRLDLTRFDGRFVGSSGLIRIPAGGQVSMYLNQAPGLESLPAPFQGVVQVVVTSGQGVAAAGLRTKYNERGRFLVTTVGPLNEDAGSPAGLIFPHIAEGSGYTTQFIVISGGSGRGGSGILRFFNQEGLPLNVTLTTP